ncbi:MAG: YfhO family protein [Bacilli bacterium]|nr:YfhO family protein [Bacilli bacterium]
MKKNKQYIIAFFIPFLIFIMVCSTANIFLGGTSNFLISDSKAQYISLFSYLKNLLSGSVSLFYSFSKGMGGNMLGTFAYYLASPLNLLIILFSNETLVIGMLLIISLKIGLSGFTMYTYLKSKYNHKNTLFIFSSCYALMGYMVVYFFNIMWLDALYFAPLILMGIDKIIKGKSSLMYCIFLFMSILTNYYTGYMLCVMACLYFIQQSIFKFNFNKDKDKILAAIIKFGIASVLAGIMTSVLLLPSVYELSANVERVGSYTNQVGIFVTNFLETFSRFFIGAQNEQNILNGESAALYSGLIILPLVYFYFVNNKINKKERIVNGTLLLILFSGLFIKPIDYFWHGFSYTNSFEFRYSFIISLFLITLACDSFYKLKNIDIKHYLIFLSGYIILSTVAIIKDYIFLNMWMVYLSVGLLILYLLIFKIYHVSNKESQKTFKLLLMVLVLSELFMNFYISIYKYKFDYKEEYNVSLETIGKEIEKVKAPDNEFYRVEKDIKFSRIDSMLMDYEGVSIFLSTISDEYEKIFGNIGHRSSTSSVQYNLNMGPITDSLFGIKYLMTNRDGLGYNQIGTFEYSKYSGLLFNLFMDEIKVYENPHALSIGFMVNDEINNFINEFAARKITNVFEVQNYFLKTMMNTDNDFVKPFKVLKKDDFNFDVIVDNNKDLYLNIPFVIMKQEDFVKIYVNDELVKINDYYSSGIFKVENKHNGEILKLRVESTFKSDFVFMPSVYYFEDDLIIEALNELKKNQLEIVERNKSYIKGNINVDDEKTVLFTSIPYEKGWTISVDGKSVDYYSVFDSFIALNLEKGTHEIEFNFTPPYLKLGALISFITLIMFIVYMRFEKQIIGFFINIYNKYEEIINYLIAGGLTTVVSISSYAVFAKLMNINYIISSVLSFVLAVVFAYFVNKIFVFKTNFKDKIAVLKESYQFIKYRLLSLGMDVMLMILFVELLHIDDLIAKIVVQVAVVIANYFFSKIFIFKK